MFLLVSYLKDTTPKSWVFNCHDFSDGKINSVQCAVKFKTQEIADEFRDEVNKAKVLHAAAVAASTSGETKEKDGATAAEEELANLDKMAESYNKMQAKRRGSATATSALADSDYDSNEEDVDEGNEDKLRAQYGIAKEGTEASATDSVTEAMAKATIKE